MRKFLLVYNPNSGDGSFKTKLDLFVSGLKENDIFIIPFRTSSREDIQNFVAALEEFSVEGILVSGGDGTVNNVINVLIKNNIDLPIGIIPAGTSNDFATFLNIPKNVEKYVKAFPKFKAMPMDLGKANDRYFFNVASAGLMTSVAHSADPMIKNTVGQLAYYIRAIGEIPNFKPFKVNFTVDNDSFTEEIFLFLVMNSRVVATFPNLAPLARIDDGKLDLLIVKKCNIPDLMVLLINLFKGEHVNLNNIRYIQAQKIDILTDEELDSDLDGELGPKLPLHIEAVHKKISILC